MVIVYHNNKRISNVVSGSNVILPFEESGTIANGLLQLAAQFPKLKLVWCHEDFREHLNLEGIEQLFHHDKMMLSYHPDESNFFGKEIGFVEESPFIKVNKNVSYPTWQMYSLAGVIHASVLLAVSGKIKADSNFEYYLNSVAKVCMPLGLLCYSEPRLLVSQHPITALKPSIFTLFKFVKQHYKTRWLFLLFLNLMVYECRFPFLPFLYGCFFKNRNKNRIDLDSITVRSTRQLVDTATIDVVIPTIGRKKYLHDVLKDLARQTHLPKNVIIVEQNPQENSVSELDYLHNEVWPFAIKHTFTHQAGACNARNLALSQVESEWVFLNDDDNRFDVDLLLNIFIEIKRYGNSVVTTSYLQKNEAQLCHKVIQWPTFGAGNSFIKTALLGRVRFDRAFEFGYGEDADFGMQLRNHGFDVLCFPQPKILHLRAPMGGFRTKPKLRWQEESIQPKPFPTVMLYKILHDSKEQLLGYKTTLFFKYYKHQKITNPILYFNNYRKQWDRSMFWANKLKKES